MADGLSCLSYGRDGIPLDVPREPRVRRLVLYAPAAGWFAATAPMLVFAGNQDTITPVQQALLLKHAPAPSTCGSRLEQITSAEVYSASGAALWATGTNGK
jgi:hypothetical protein